MTKELQDAIRHIKTRADAWAVKEIVDALKQEPCDAISREAVLSVIDGWYEQNRDIENIEDLIILITYMSSVQPSHKGHWIPVSERLPERNKRVIVCYETMEGLKVDTSIFDKYGCLIGEAVAWMSLPEPYKDMRGDTE